MKNVALDNAVIQNTNFNKTYWDNTSIMGANVINTYLSIHRLGGFWGINKEIEELFPQDDSWLNFSSCKWESTEVKFVGLWAKVMAFDTLKPYILK